MNRKLTTAGIDFYITLRDSDPCKLKFSPKDFLIGKWFKSIETNKFYVLIGLVEEVKNHI